MIRLPRLPINWKDQPQLFERYWDQVLNQIEDSINSQPISTDNWRLGLSFIECPTPVVQIDGAGLITILNHKRIYADGSAVNVTGGSVQTIGIEGDIYRIYYQDSSFKGGTVLYQYSKDPLNKPLQTNGIHTVGTVVRPSTGIVFGTSPGPFGSVII